jgi:membrane-associated protease RseP (regulator of RpoE activity)
MQHQYYLPYIVSYSPINVEQLAIFTVAILTAIMVSAEGQAFAATLLGDNRIDAKDRHHFNVFLHMSLLGTLCFFIGGFGWAKKIDIDVSRFRSVPRISLICSRLAGPAANLLLASIAASINWLLARYTIEDVVFEMIAIVNITMAVYSLLIIPPLPGASIISAFFSKKKERKRDIEGYIDLVGSILVLIVFLVIRLKGWHQVSDLTNPIVLAIFHFIVGS